MPGGPRLLIHLPPSAKALPVRNSAMPRDECSTVGPRSRSEAISFLKFHKQKACRNLGGLFFLSALRKLSHRPRIERCQRVVQPPMVGPGFLLAAGHIEHEAEYLPPNFFYSCSAGSDAAGVNINQVGPALGQCCARRNFDHRDHRQSVGTSLPRSENMKVHRSELLRSADEIARRRGSENQALGRDLFALRRGRHPRRSARCGDRTQSFFYDVCQSAAFVARRRLATPLRLPAPQLIALPLPLATRAPSR